MRDAQSIIKRPLLTEKSARLRGDRRRLRRARRGRCLQQVVFEVPRDSNKIEIRRAVQDLFRSPSPMSAP